MEVKEVELTQERLKEVLKYDPDTGIFVWKVRLSKSIHVGDVAGCGDGKGYTKIRVFRKKYLAHRLAFLYMTGVMPPAKIDVDHIDHNRNNNVWSNLRLVTRQGNNMNRPMSRNNTSGFTGIRRNKVSRKWEVYIGVRGKDRYLGCFIDLGEAIKVRKAAEVKYGYHENHGNSAKQLQEVNYSD